MLACVSQTEREEIFGYWSGRFGVPSTALAALQFLIRGKNVWAVANLDGLEKALASLKVEAAGLPFLRRQRRMWKPTTAALLFLDGRITKNVVHLTEEQLHPFLRGEILPGPLVVEPGYVAVCYGEKMLGCALYGKGGLKSQLPRAWVAVLLGRKPEMEEEQ
ncbi:MAG: hypothetical protein ACE5K9_07195 [Candidatus Methylomirabilales bacterium]